MHVLPHACIMISVLLCVLVSTLNTTVCVWECVRSHTHRDGVMKGKVTHSSSLGGWMNGHPVPALEASVCDMAAECDVTAACVLML